MKVVFERGEESGISVCSLSSSSLRSATSARRNLFLRANGVSSDANVYNFCDEFGRGGGNDAFVSGSSVVAFSCVLES